MNFAFCFGESTSITDRVLKIKTINIVYGDSCAFGLYANVWRSLMSFTQQNAGKNVPDVWLYYIQNTRDEKISYSAD